MSRWLVFLWCLGAAVFVGFLLNDTAGVPVSIGLPIAFVVFSGIGEALYRYAGRPPAQETEVRARSNDDVKSEALALLSDSRRYRVELAANPWSRSVGMNLPTDVRVLFDEWVRIESLETGLTLARTLVQRSTVNPTYERIGVDTDHTEVCVKPGTNEVFILADDVEATEQIEEVFTSVFHLIVDR